MFGIKDILQQAQGLHSKMNALQEELAERVVSGAAGGDMVTVEATCAMEVVSLKIDKDTFASGDQEMIQDLVMAAVNDALKKARDTMQQEMTKLTGGLKIPGVTM